MLIIYLVLGLASGAWASSIARAKRRDPLGWFCAGFLFGLLGVIIAVAAAPIAPIEKTAWD